MALVLREADVRELAEMGAVMGALEAAMREQGQGLAQNQPRRRVFPPGGLLNVMFASWPGGGLTGLKAYTVADGKVRFLVTAFDLEGRLEALIEADWMGTFRTGAATGVAVRTLSPPGPKTVAVIGTGWQARTQVQALRLALDIGELRVFGRDPLRRAEFAALVGAVPSATAEACVRGADVVVAITTSSTPVLEAEWVGGRTVVVGAGSNFAGRAELPAELIHGAAAVVVDQIETARLESGDLLQAGYDMDQAVELGAVLAGTAAIDLEAGPVVFESHGLALWDLAAARTVIDAARERGAGRAIELLDGQGQ